MRTWMPSFFKNISGSFALLWVLYISSLQLCHWAFIFVAPKWINLRFSNIKPCLPSTIQLATPLFWLGPLIKLLYPVMMSLLPCLELFFSKHRDSTIYSKLYNSYEQVKQKYTESWCTSLDHLENIPLITTLWTRSCNKFYVQVHMILSIPADLNL